MESDQDSVRTLKGIGDKTGKLFEKLGIFTIQDLLGYYPREYHVYEEPSPIGDLKADMAGAAAGVLQKSASVRAFQNKKVITASLRDETGTLQLTWFNMPFLKNTLQAGTYHVFYGKVVKKNNRLTMEQPEIFTREGYQAMMESMQPVYGQTKGLGNKAITKAVAQALLRRQMEREYLPAYIRKKYELAEYNFALEHIHFPENRQQLLFARKRLVFDEFFLFILAVRRLKEKRQDRKSAWVMKAAPQVAKLMEDLPYDLTRAQRKVLDEIMEDMAGGLVMNRLVQGDVGSGKTVIAIMALLTAAYNGCQGAMMAPTEVLARQHYEGMRRMFADCGIDKVPVLLTGSMTAKEKRMAYEKIKSHEADIIVGTHALIQDKVVYDRAAPVRRGAAADIWGQGPGTSCSGHERHADTQNVGHYLIRGSGHFRYRSDAVGPAAGEKLRCRNRLSAQCLLVYKETGGAGAAGLCDLSHGGVQRDDGGGECAAGDRS